MKVWDCDQDCDGSLQRRGLQVGNHVHVVRAPQHLPTELLTEQPEYEPFKYGNPRSGSRTEVL